MHTGPGSRSRLHRRAFFAIALLAGSAGHVLAEPAPQPDVTGAYSEYLVGRYALAEGDLTTAAIQLAEAQAADPENPELLREAFLAEALAGRPDALRLARQLPGSQVAQMLLANDDAAAGRWDSATKRFLALTHDGPAQVWQPLLTAWSQFGGGNADAALGTLRPFVEGPRRAAGAYELHAALIADLAGRPEAGRLYKAARASYVGLNLRLAEILASWQDRQPGAGHRREAEATLRTLIEHAPEMAIAAPGLIAAMGARVVPDAAAGLAETYLALAASLQQQDAGDSARLMLGFALQLRPDLTAARLLLADLQDSDHRFAAALQTLAAVPPTDPLIALVRLRRVSLMVRGGDNDAALRELALLAHDVPDSPLPLMQRGDILREAGKFKDAVGAYNDAAARIHHVQPSDWSLFYARAIAEDGAHDWPHAEADLNRALQLSPNQPSVLNYLAYSWTEQNRNLARARQMLERAADLRPNEGSIIDSLGWLELHQGQTGPAVATLERAVELEPEDPVINGHLGDAYHQAGRTLDAVFQWQRALTFHPNAADKTALEAKLHDAAPTGTTIRANGGASSDAALAGGVPGHRVQ